MDERRPDDKPAMGRLNEAPTEQFEPVAAPPTGDASATPPPATPPPAAPPASWAQPAPPPAPPAGWQPPSTPPAAPPASWQSPSSPPTGWQRPGAQAGAPGGWVGPQAASGPWAPAAGMPPGMVGYREPGVTGLAKLGSVILIVFGLLIGLVGVLFIVAAGVLRDALGAQTEDVRDFFTTLAAGIGIVVTGLMLVQILVGIFSWRGSGFARMLGVIYGILFGLLFLAGLTNTRAAPDGSGNSLIPTLIFGLGYLYVAVVFLFRFRGRSA